LSLKKIVSISIVLLVAIIVVSIPSILQNITVVQSGLKPIEFSLPLDLTDDQTTEHTIISYLINRDNQPEDPLKAVHPDRLDEYYNISITLQSIRSVNGTSFENHTKSSQIRWFIASIVDYSKPNKETSISGWVDTYRHVHEIGGHSSITITDKTILPEFSFNMDLLYTINYTGLPENENVNVYPESHLISDSFKIVFENNRPEELLWGSDWQFEKWVNDEWITPNITRVWTLELRFIGAYARRTDGHKFPFDDGLYRISKRCWLTDDYDRDKKEWVGEFTTSFYLIKMSD
jgi:hypothetical protein